MVLTMMHEVRFHFYFVTFRLYLFTLTQGSIITYMLLYIYFKQFLSMKLIPKCYNYTVSIRLLIKTSSKNNLAVRQQFYIRVNLSRSLPSFTTIQMQSLSFCTLRDHYICFSVLLSIIITQILHPNKPFFIIHSNTMQNNFLF